MMARVILAIILLLISQKVVGKKPVTFAVVLLHPYSQINPQTGECEGETLSKAKEVFAQYKHPMEMLCLPPFRFVKEFNKDKIDITINIKLNPHLRDKAHFIDPPFRVLKLNLYTKLPLSADKTIAAINGFDYGGKRLVLQEQDYELLDLPSATSSLQTFIRGKAGRILFYHPQMDYFEGKKLIQLDESIQVEKLAEIYTHFAIAKHSAHFKSLHNYLQAYISTNKVERFVEH